MINCVQMNASGIVHRSDVIISCVIASIYSSRKVEHFRCLSFKMGVTPTELGSSNANYYSLMWVWHSIALC